MNVFEVPLLVTSWLGLYPKKCSDRKQVKKFVVFISNCVASFILLVFELIHTNCNFTVVLMTAVVSFNFLRIIHFCIMREKTVQLYDDIVESFLKVESKAFLNVAEKVATKFMIFGFAAFTLRLIACFGNLVFTDNMILPLYKPEAWENSAVVDVMYCCLQFVTATGCYVMLLCVNLIAICFMTYLTELAMVVKYKFEKMVSKSDLKDCVEQHLNLKR
jgi:hypothetical protein